MFFIFHALFSYFFSKTKCEHVGQFKEPFSGPESSVFCRTRPTIGNRIWVFQGKEVSLARLFGHLSYVHVTYCPSLDKTTISYLTRITFSELKKLKSQLVQPTIKKKEKMDIFEEIRSISRNRNFWPGSEKYFIYTTVTA